MSIWPAKPMLFRLDERVCDRGMVTTPAHSDPKNEIIPCLLGVHDLQYVDCYTDLIVENRLPDGISDRMVKSFEGDLFGGS